MTQTPQHGFADDAQRYRLDSRIATGGMGEVWRATDTTLGREVAVKLLKAEYADDATFRSRFETEARHAAALHHPGVAGVYDFGEASPADGSPGGKPFLVMELVDGQPLSALLAEAKRAGRELDPAVVQDLVAQAGDALGAAHAAGIVHRDVKPANLMVTPDGTVKITDFGIARAADGAQITQTGAVMGTPQYLSPEQARGEAATPASDVYALGVVAFECLAGRRPFEAESPVATALAHLRDPVPDLPARVPSDLALVVRRSLSKDPADRFDDGRAFASAVRRPETAAAAAAAVDPDAGRTQVFPATSSTAVAPPPPSTPPEGVAPVALAPEPGRDEEADKKKRRRAIWIALLALLLVLLLVVGLFALLNGGDDTDDEPTRDRTRRDRTPSSSAPTTTPPTTPTTTAPATVEVDPDDYVGQPVDQVTADLQALGLNVQQNEVTNDGSQDEGIVSGLNPTGTVDEGSTITVDFYGPPPETPTATPTETEESPETPDTPDGPGGEGPGGEGPPGQDGRADTEPGVTAPEVGPGTGP